MNACSPKKGTLWLHFYVFDMLSFSCSEIEFKLQFGCDVPTHIDQGVRFEVRNRDDTNWDPIRFYTPSLTPAVVGSLVTPLPNNSVRAQFDDYASALPLVVINTTEPVTVREYLCGRYVSLIRDGQEINLRWFQRYQTNPGREIATWFLDDIKIKLWNGNCFVPVLSENFNNIDSGVDGITYNTAAGGVAPNFCPISANNALYFNLQPTGGTIFRRSLIIRIGTSYEVGSCESTISGEFISMT